MYKKQKMKKIQISFFLFSLLLFSILFSAMNSGIVDKNNEKLQKPLVAGTLTRTGYPVILDNNTAGGILWNTLKNHHVHNIRIAYYDGAAWQLVPFQLDEMGYFRSYAYETGVHASGDASSIYTEQTNWGHFIAEHRYVGNHVDDYAASATELSRYDCEMEFWEARAAEYYTDAEWSEGDAPQAEPPIQPDSAVYPYNLEQPGEIWEQLPDRIDYDDELCFNSYNGDQVSTSIWWNATSYPYRYELEIIDPVSGGGSGFMYLYYNDETATSPPTNNYFMPNGASDDQVSWNPSTLTVTGENYEYVFDSTGDRAYLGTISIEGITIFNEWNKEWQELQLDIQRTGILGIGAIDSQSDLDTGRIGTWNGVFYDQIVTDIGYGTTMDFDLINLALDPSVFPGQDGDYTNGHRPYNQPLSGGSNHGTVWDEQDDILGVIVCAWDDGCDHDGNYGSNSEYPPFVRGLITFGHGHQAAIDGPIRVVVDQFSLRTVQFFFSDNAMNEMVYEEGLRFDRRSTLFYANEMKEMPYEINLDYSGRGAGDPNLEVFMNPYYMFFAGTRLDSIIGLSGAQIRLGRAPAGYGYTQCDAVYDTVRILTPDGASSGDYLSSSSGPIEGNYDESSPIISGNPLSDWRYVKTDNVGAWSYVPVQEMTEMFSGDTHSSVQWYWQDSGSITEMSIYGNDGATNSITGELDSLRTYFDDGTLTDIECKNQYVFSKEGFTVTCTYQETDTTPPIWIDPPVSETIELGDDVYQDVEASDPSTPIVYSISGTGMGSFSINSGTGELTNSEVLSVGSYDINVIATDAASNALTTPITITVEDTTDPVWNPTPFDQTVEIDGTLSYDVNADDLSVITYSIDDTINFAINASTGLITSSALAVGDYPLLITATDSEGNYITASITIHFVDSTDPVWNPTPFDQTVEIDGTLSYDVNADDLSVITYSIDDTINFDINPSTGLITSSALPVGDYPLLITASDPFNNNITASITIHFVDTTDPVWNPTPVDQTVIFGNSLSYTVNAYDLSAITYSINDTINFDINPSTGLITSNILPIGDYPLLITATDSEGNYITAVIIVSVTTAEPYWSPTPEDQTVEIDGTLSYQVNAVDADGITYSIDDTINFDINPSTGLITSSSLPVGDYPLLITASDPYNNNITASITIHFVDTTDPVWNPMPDNQTVEIDGTLSYDVNADDLSVITYSIDDTINFDINPSTGLITSTALPVGEYPLLITATDSEGNYITAYIIIHFVDTTDPVWNPTPDDQTVIFGDSLSYDVNADDLSAITYSIDDTMNFTINPSTGLITSNVLPIGDYPLLITATDSEGNYITAFIIISVKMAEPYWSPTPEDQTVEIDGTLSYQVNAVDADGITYSIDDTINFDINPSTGLITSSSLPVGDYQLLITASDPYNNNITASITIHFVDTTDPVWNPMPDNQTVEIDGTLSYDVNADDLSVITYSIDDTTNFAINPSTGLITSTALPVGDYPLLITATDSEGNYIIASITIHFVDTTDPVWNPTPVDQIVGFGSSLNYTVNADDLSAITYSIDDTTNFAINPSTGLITSAALPVGDYPLLITATDSEGNYITASITIHFVDLSPPAKVKNVIVMQTDLGDGVYLEWDANSEVNLDYYNIYCNGILIGNTTETSFYYYANGKDAINFLDTYQISAVNNMSIEGELSDPVSLLKTAPEVTIVNYLEDFIYLFTLVFGCGIVLVIGVGYIGSAIAKRRKR